MVVRCISIPWVMSMCDPQCPAGLQCFNATCLPNVDYGFPCILSAQCKESDLVSCIDSICSCRHGLKRIRDECLPQDYCSFDIDCGEKEFCMRRLHKCSTSPPPAFFWTLGFGIGITVCAGILVSCLNTREGRTRLELASAGHYMVVPIHVQATTQNQSPSRSLNRSPNRAERCDSTCTDSEHNDLPPPFEEPPAYEDLEPLNKKPESLTQS